VDLALVIERIVGEPVALIEQVGGGDIGESAVATLSAGERIFAKHYPASPPEAVRCEADGLRWLAEPGVVPVVQPRGFDEASRVLVLDWIEPGRPSPGGDAEFGRALAALHRSGAPGFGALPDNFIGSLPQSNRTHATWPAFYGKERITKLARRATDAGLLDPGDSARIEALVDRLPELFPDDAPPSRLHGDLWGGNRLADASGTSWLIDPAAYGGHREMDLAMMRLFGGFSDAVFAAYEEVWPLTPGASERIGLCQLYPMLVHVNLFGRSYVGSVRRILDAYD